MHFAILGTSDQLSLLELESLLGERVAQASPDVALFESERSHGELMTQLGGTQKIGVVLRTIANVSTESLVDALSTFLLDAERPSGKTLIGMSVYNMNDVALKNRLSKSLAKLQMTLKNRLKDEGRNVRIVVSKNETLHSAAIKKNKLLKKGYEFVLIATQKGVTIGITKIIQDLDEWSYKDMHRPWRNAKQGMLPPKLARMMINLADAKPSHAKTLLDPFCGSGTLLMEAGELGFSCIGSDINPQAIHDTELNSKWLISKGFNAKPPKLYTTSAEHLHNILENNSVDVIVTEPFLGAPRKGKESVQDVKRAIDELERLYVRCFRSLYSVLKPGGTILISNPVHMVGATMIEPKTTDILVGIGFKQVPFAKDLLYKRDGQFVGRHILRFEKK